MTDDPNLGLYVAGLCASVAAFVVLISRAWRG